MVSSPKGSQFEAKIRFVPWQEKVMPTRDTIRERFRAEGLSASEWSNQPGYVYPDHTHSYHKVIYAVQGSITFTLPDTGEAIEMSAGDRLDLAAGTVHGAVVGKQGVVCWEAHREA